MCISSGARSLFQSKKIPMSGLSDAQLADEIEDCIPNTPWAIQLDRELTRRIRAEEQALQEQVQAAYA